MLGLLAAGCITAAAGGAYVAVRQNAAPAPPAPVEAAAPAPAPALADKPVEETEAVIEPPAPPVEPEVAVRKAAATPPKAAEVERPRRQPTPSRTKRTERPVAAAAGPAPVAEPALEVTPPPAAPAPVVPPAVVEPAAAEPLRPVETVPPPPEFVEVVIPASAVIGLQVDTPLTSERARVEDRVEARVTRDVSSAGRVAIPAGSRALGSVTLVERGGKIKERARLGVRFHTLVLADGTEVRIVTEPVFREGESPSGESARKIGGAAAGGAILGAILGGGKGAILGGAAGAAGGTAATMAGGRNAATLPAGTVLTVRLASPVSVDVEKR
jgi:hypothetical protein